MNVKFIKDINLSVILEQIDWYIANKFSGVVIFVAFLDYENFKLCTREYGFDGIKVAGGFFPYISFRGELYDQGALMLGFKADVHIEEVKAVEAENISHKSDNEGHSAIVLLDALSADSEDHINVINNLTDPNLPIIGMGAGALDFVHRPVLFTNRGFVKDSSLLIFIKLDILQTAAHGYEAIAGPFLTTRTEGITTYELNYMPAFDVYANSIKQVTQQSLDVNKFFEWAKPYPLGVENSDGSFIIRDPITTNGEAFSCVGSIPQNSIIYIMKAEVDGMIKSSQEAALDISDLFRAEKNRQANLVFSIGCISRKLFMGEQYDAELQAANTIDAAEHAGVLSLGEISNYNASNANLLNKTLVLGLF